MSMTPEEWKAVCDDITDRMREHTRPFVTPLSYRAGTFHKLAGSGSYVGRNDEHLLLTCEHVARIGKNIEQRFFGSNADHNVREPFVVRADPVIDLAWSRIPDFMWDGAKSSAIQIPYERFAAKHAIRDKFEPLFFRGFAGENVVYRPVERSTPLLPLREAGLRELS
jgi:hypothetical protein